MLKDKSDVVAPQIVVPAQIVVGDNLCKTLTPQIVAPCTNCRRRQFVQGADTTNCRLFTSTNLFVKYYVQAYLSAQTELLNMISSLPAQT